MSWTSPTKYPTGTLINTSIWWTDIVDNLNYLYGAGGAIEQLTVNQHILHLYAGGRYKASPNLREVRVAPDGVGNYIMESSSSGSGAGFNDGGGGQGVLDMDPGSAGAIAIYLKDAQHSALATSFTVTKSPYFRIEFSLDALSVSMIMCFGFRTTKTAQTNPNPASESYALTRIDGLGHLYFENGNGSGGGTNSTTITPSTGKRHVIEIKITSATKVEYWYDGVLWYTAATSLPVGTVEPVLLFGSTGFAGGSAIHCTIGELIAQEDAG